VKKEKFHDLLRNLSVEKSQHPKKTEHQHHQHHLERKRHVHDEDN
jgi:hypothetical protein